MMVRDKVNNDSVMRHNCHKAEITVKNKKTNNENKT